MTRLVRVEPYVDPGIRRVRAGSGFRYIDAGGDPVADAVNRRVRSLVIPPAWDDVWIAADPAAHIQVVGVDDAGRRQYLYHPRWRHRRDRSKFARALDLAEALPHARGHVTAALRAGVAAGAPDRDSVLAASFRLLDEAAPRIGSARYLARHGSRGLTTLQRRDATVVTPLVTLSFPAKSRQHALIEIDDADLAPLISVLRTGRPRSALLWHPRGRRQVALTAAEVNAHVQELTGGAFTAKDFRTLRGTTLAAATLAGFGTVDSARDRSEAERFAVQAVATALGNTPAVARSSYIDPRVFTAYGAGRLLDLTVSPETAIRRLLAE